MKLIDQLNLDDTGRRLLQLYCYRQAAINFEAVHRYRDAAECWEEAGEVDRALALLLQHQDPATAARLLWKRGRYREALDCYQRWLEQIAPTDVTTMVQAHLGLAACCDRLDEAPDRRQAHYRQARAALEAADLPAQARGACWRAVGEYGSRVGRWDLIHLGYEQALRYLVGDRRTMPVVLREYLEAVAGNRLLVRRLREQLAEYEVPSRRPKPQGEALRAAAEQIREVRRFEGHTGQVFSVSFSADDRLLASGSSDRTVRLWDPETGQELRRLEGHGIVRSVSFSTDGRLLASGGEDQSVRLWDPGTGRELRCLSGHKDTVFSVSFSAGSRLLVSGGDDGTVRLWDPKKGEELRCLRGHQGRVHSVNFSADDRLLASGGADGTVRLWDPGTGQELRCLRGHEGRVWSVSFSADSRLLASGGADGTVRLWDPDTGQELRRLEGHSEIVYLVEFSPDGRVLATQGNDRTCRLWDAFRSNSILTIEILFDGVIGVQGIVFSRDGRYFVSVAADTHAPRLYDVSALDLAPE
jgi:hypothetical protein